MPKTKETRWELIRYLLYSVIAVTSVGYDIVSNPDAYFSKPAQQTSQKDPSIKKKGIVVDKGKLEKAHESYIKSINPKPLIVKSLLEHYLTIGKTHLNNGNAALGISNLEEVIMHYKRLASPSQLDNLQLAKAQYLIAKEKSKTEDPNEIFEKYLMSVINFGASVDPKNCPPFVEQAVDLSMKLLEDSPNQYINGQLKNIKQKFSTQ